MLRLFSFSVCTIIFSCVTIYGAEFPECNNEPLKSFVAVNSSCSKAIYCHGLESVMVDCDEKNPYFSSTDRKCHKSTNVCGNRPFGLLSIPTVTPLAVPSVTTSIATNSDGSPAESKPTTISSSVATSTITTLTEMPVRSTTTPNHQVFPTTLMSNQVSTTVREPLTSSVFTTSSSKPTDTTVLNSVLVQCPVVDNPNKPLFLPHPRSCSLYFICYHGVATLMKCANKLHFDAAQKTCNTPKEAKCEVNFLIPREKCQRDTVSFYPHPTNCNYYYLCVYGFLTVMQCPFNMYWNNEDRVCAMRPMANCYNENSIDRL